MTRLFDLLFSIASIFFRGWVFAFLWSWFVVPLSSSIPELNLMHGTGLWIFAKYATRSPQLIAAGTAMDDLKTSITIGFVAPLITLVVAWVIHCWM